jgi:hypothetical protein
MPTSDLEAVGVEENAPMPLSSLSPIAPLSGLHMNPEPGEDPYVHSPSAYDSGENCRQMSVPLSSRQGSHSYQGNGSRASTQTWDNRVTESVESASDFNRASHPVLAAGQSNISQSKFTQNGERRGSQPENLSQSNHRTGRRTSHQFSTNRRERIPEENQGPESNTQIWQNLTRTGSNAIAPAELAIASSTTSSESLKWWRRRPSFTQTDRKPGRWLFLLFSLTISLLIGLIVSLAFDFKLKKSGKPQPLMPIPTLLPQASILPIIDSCIGAGNAVIGTYFSTQGSGVLQTKLAYNAGNGRICIRTKSGTDWLNVQCLEGANPRANTPFAFLDWLGGPSIYYITADNFLSGLDHMPVNGKSCSPTNAADSGELSSLAKEGCFPILRFFEVYLIQRC